MTQPRLQSSREARVGAGRGRMIARVMALAFFVSALTCGSLFLKPASSAHAQVQRNDMASQAAVKTVRTQALTNNVVRLDSFVLGTDKAIWHQWSDDSGATWSGWESLGGSVPSNPFKSAPSVASDGTGQVDVFETTNGGSILNDRYFNNHWSGWQAIDYGPLLVVGGVLDSDSHNYDVNSAPVVTSWGPGRFDMFVNTIEEGTGAIALLHLWADNDVWTHNWEVLGTGLMQGDPAAVSWGSGRVDVFVRGGGSELDHKWFDNGHWSSGWENLGGIMTSSPTVGSWQPGELDVFARSADGGLYHQWFGNGQWSTGEILDSTVFASNPAVATEGPGTWDLFAMGTDNSLLHKEYRYGTWYSWQNQGAAITAAPAATYWTTSIVIQPPPTPTPQPTPSPTPIPRSCGVGTGRPCTVNP